MMTSWHWERERKKERKKERKREREREIEGETKYKKEGIKVLRHKKDK